MWRWRKLRRISLTYRRKKEGSAAIGSVNLRFLPKFGCVAKNEERRKKSELRSDLWGNPEEIRHELDLHLNLTSAYSRNLPLPNYVYRFVSPDCSPR